MNFSHDDNKYYIVSIVLHIVLLLVLVMGFDSSSMLPVFENTNQTDVISAVVLGDTAKSKILPKKIVKEQPLPPKVEPEKPKEKPKVVEKTKVEEPKKEAIALEKPEKKKKVVEKKVEKKLDIFGKDLLADIKKQTEKEKKESQKKLQNKFQKMLQEQAEKSLRQQLLNEEIKLQGTQSRQSQGEVNKYKALILQAISEHWIIPTSANKKLSCELMIRVAPGGMVLDVQVTRSSGDPSLDSSARAAVMKASPLPVPSSGNEFDAFRQFVLKVKPENVLDGGMGVG